MKKIMKVCLCGLTAAALVSGCSQKATDKSTQAPNVKGAETESTTATNSTAQENMAVEDLSDIDNGTITLGKYKGIEVTKGSAEVTDEELNQMIQTDLDSHPNFVEVDRAIQNDDKVNIDYAGTKDGKAFKGGTAQGQELTIGTNMFIDGFEDGLIGHKKGDKVRLNLTFPEKYQDESLAGQEVVFDVTINKVTERKDAKLDDDFVKKNSDFTTVAEYMSDKKKILEDSKKQQVEQNLKNDIYTAALKEAKIETSQEAIDANYNNLLARYTNQAAAYGMDITSFAQAAAGMSEGDFKTTLKKQAESIVEQRLLMNAIAEKEGIKVTDEDRENTAKEMNYESADKMIEAAGKFAVDDYIISMKVIDFLTKNAVVK